jgi:hypothetical protein
MPRNDNASAVTIPANLCCKRCSGLKADKKYVYCKPCSKIMKKEMEASGFLQSIDFRQTHNRPREAREDIYETKFGVDA